MAKRVTKAAQAVPKSGKEDLRIAHAQLELQIGDRHLVLREYSFIEGLRMRARLAPFVTEVDAHALAGGEGLSEDLIDIFAKHEALLQEAMALSAGVEVAWIRDLDLIDGERLLYAWWGICGPFFVQLLLRRTTERLERMKQLAYLAAAGPTSSTTSSPPATETPASSSATRTGS